MPSNPLLHLITELINIEEIKVVNYDFITDNEIVIEIQNQSKVSHCPRWGKTTNKTHQNHWYMVKDIPMSDYQVIFKVNRRQLKCTECDKVFLEEGFY